MEAQLTDKELTLKNLRYVYEELPRLAEKIPSIITDFNMRLYGCYINLPKEQLHKCNSMGCLLGNAARLFEIKEQYFHISGFDYTRFGQSVFPYLYDLGRPNKDWFFLFFEDWEKYQPTFEQAMQRLKFFIDCNGDLPEWELQEEPFILE